MANGLTKSQVEALPQLTYQQNGVATDTLQSWCVRAGKSGANAVFAGDLPPVGSRELALDSSPSITALTGTLQDRLRPFGPIDYDWPVYKAPINAGVASFSAVYAVGGGGITEGGGVITKTSDGYCQITGSFRCRDPYLTAVVGVRSLEASSTANVGVGFGKKAVNASTQINTSIAHQSGQRVMAHAFAATSEVAIYVGDTAVITVSADLAGSFELALCMQGNVISAWLRKSGGGWYYVAGCTNTAYDLQDESIITLHAPFIQLGDGDLVVDKFEVYRPLGTGLSNPSVLKYETGEPIIIDGDHYFLANAPTFLAVDGPYTGINASQLCVWAYNLASQTLRRTAILTMRRGGRLHGESNGDATFDRETGKWILIIPPWGDVELGSRIDNRIAVTSANIMSGVHVLDSTLMDVDTDPNWDPALVKIDGVWHLAYSCAPGATGLPWPSGFELRLATSADLVTWTRATTNITVPDNSEGTKVVWIGGAVFYNCCSTAASNIYFLSVGDLSTLAVRSFPDLDHSGPASHTQICNYPEGDNTRYMVLSMDKAPFRGISYSWGSLTVHKIHETADGWDFIQSHQ